ncbi:MAG: hypothetical protein Q8P18_19835 [Pseudomonadota bacterium]|nr:hypothetical protein [Pseudomonadota bacterium]
MSPQWPSEVFAAYADVLARSGGVLFAPLVGAIVLFVILWSGDKPLPKVVASGLLAACAVAGLVLALRNLSVVDDANYSFRYAENWVAGKGIVFNVGERVEGYTNFLWVALLAAFSALTPFRPHWIALVLGLACFVGTVAAVARLGSRLHEGGAGRLPAAACYLALNTTFVVFATTGLETMCASLLVCLGLLALVAERPRPMLASVGFLLAALARPDHALFWGAGFVAVALAERRSLAAWGATLARYLVPLAPYGGYLLWKIAYYGSILPNSYYVRAANESHVEQGLVYALTFLLGSHAWLVLALFLASLAIPTVHEPARVFRRFAGVAVPVWAVYVTWVGGDYMYGRFYMVILPLLALGAERLVHAVRERRAWVGAVLGGLFVATACGVPLLPARQARWGIADEPTFDDHTWRDLIDADAILSSRVAYSFQEIVDQGLDLPIEGTGGFGYRTRLRVVEACGLVDPTVANRERSGTMAGHEKCVSREDLIEQGVRLSFTRSVFAMGPSAGVPLLDGRPIDRLCDATVCINILAYDGPQMRALRDATTGILFVDLEAYLDAWLARADTTPPEQLRADILFFREYYFRFNEDPDRLAAVDRVATASAAPAGMPPPGTPPPGAPPGPGLDGMSGFRERLNRP